MVLHHDTLHPSQCSDGIGNLLNIVLSACRDEAADPACWNFKSLLRVSKRETKCNVDVHFHCSWICLYLHTGKFFCIFSGKYVNYPSLKFTF